MFEDEAVDVTGSLEVEYLLRVMSASKWRTGRGTVSKDRKDNS